MKVILANLLALLFLCTCACVFYILTGLESRLERHRMDFHIPGAASPHPGPSPDLPPKTFRALLAVPSAQRLYFENGVDVHNLSGSTDQSDNFGNKRNSNLNVNNRGTVGEVPIKMNQLVEDGIFWSEQLETWLPAGFTEEHTQIWRERVRGYPIVSLEPGCGRISNRLATFSDGTKACVRYGINADQVQGETLTYYLASLLGIPNLPPLALSQLNPDSEQWASVKGSIASLQWTGKAIVSLTEWVANLTGVVTPAPLRQEGKGLHPLKEELENKTMGELLELMQWSDLILFDYLTANFDRLVSNLFSLQWDSRVMERDTSNLHKTPSGDLVFIDNEAGLVHGYRVLHMWEKYHSTLMGSVCIFRKRTAQRVIELHRLRDTRTRLLELYRDSEPLAPELGFLSDEHAGILQNRIDRLYKHILHCKGKYSQL
ncbi:four-jointed box protein 1 [Megalops cyprinoides]|uniref:four-jointed box protein 1 n=1 Tax=Megalops cyprinoides TaxID=118141 RepID=UPI0018655FA3|nr:four-jointed box protein 1 [Megalops cyprinoides]